MGAIRDRGHDGGNIYRWETLKRFVEENDWKKGAELGVYNGVNFKYLIENCPKLTLIGIDLYEPQPENSGPEKWTPGENGHRWDHNSYYSDMKKFCSKYPKRAFIIKDYTTNAANLYEDKYFDFVFIDADHGYEGCLRDIKAWEPKVKGGGIVFGHDIHFPTVKKAVTEYFGENSWNVEDDFVWWVRK
jgi:hypothetical protein